MTVMSDVWKAAIGKWLERRDGVEEVDEWRAVNTVGWKDGND
jgi:hypothetical protein